MTNAESDDDWIECTPETMPETTDEVLTTYIVNGNNNKRFVESATWYPDDVDGYWSSPWDEYRVPGTRVGVTAWMPLPKPYKPKKKENQ